GDRCVRAVVSDGSMATRRGLGVAVRRTARRRPLLTVADYTFTRCPGCGTIFRVTAEQLALREGQVRCGHCRAVFDANDNVITLDVVAPEDFRVDDELLRRLPTVTLDS